MADMEKWNHKDEWKQRGKNFMVSVSRHSVKSDEHAPHRWCVYVYIYSQHPHFKNFSVNAMWQDAASMLPLHGGPTFLRWHFDESGNAPVTVQVGCDYNHLYDDNFTRSATPNEAYEVFSDAQTLFDWMANYESAEV